MRPSARRRGLLRAMLRRAGRIALASAWSAATGWCTLAIGLGPSGPSVLTWSLAAGFAAICLAVAAGPMPRAARGRKARTTLLAASWGAVAAWFLWVPAPAEADWLPDVRQDPSFEIDGSSVTVSGIRNFRYGTSDSDVTEVWTERTYDLRTLRTVDLFFSYWGPGLICHNFVSFGFARPDGGTEQLAVSIEARKRKGQEYSAVGGLFRQYRLAYVWADERDVVRVRTNFRGERVRRYRVEATEANVRILFERYMLDTVDTVHRPRWYNAVTQNCGIDILRTAWGQEVPTVPSPRLLLNGTWERQAWEDGRTAPPLDYEETIRNADITDDAKEAPIREFSRAIRGRESWMRLASPASR